MSVLQVPPPKKIIYPDSDGKPMAENTLQFQWITTVKGGFDAQYTREPSVFVAGDLFWYPVEGHPEICQAPDVLLAFGRPKGHRGSYKQWEEGGIAPQVVWEILSPGNRFGEMLRKFQFYERYGVEEYVVFDPDSQVLFVYGRKGEKLVEVEDPRNWVSPRTGIRFDFSGDEMRVIGRDGKPFLSYEELAAQRERERGERERAERQAAEATARNERLAAQLRALGVEPEA